MPAIGATIRFETCLLSAFNFLWGAFLLCECISAFVLGMLPGTARGFAGIF
jgi:hypothetical protein